MNPGGSPSLSRIPSRAPRPDASGQGENGRRASRPVAIDLFAGGGGTTLALEWAGFDVPIAVEMDPSKAATLRANHPRTTVLGHGNTVGDVTQLSGKDILKAGGLTRFPALVVGCPPCQGYSTQGPRSPRDPRNRLYEDFIRLTGELRPQAVALENVPGMASLSHGRFLSALVSGLEGVGYRTDLWMLKASEAGVPQDRRRMFVVGVRSGEPPSKPGAAPAPTVWDAISDLPQIAFRPLADRGRGVSYVSKPISSYARRLRGRTKTVTGCEVTRHDPAVVVRFRGLSPGETDKLTRHRRLDPQGFATTLTAGSRMRTACRPVHPYRHRVLTVREAARLASFPDWYKFPPEISEAWCQIGNAVPPMMAQAVFSQLRAVLG
jgi:DNA (cytosine-5)-methyltransferase 1